MLMGDTCTRACQFCSVNTGNPKGWLDEYEPKNIADTVFKMGLKYIVLTCVNRDDLADGGAEHFAKTVEEIKKKDSTIAVEVLTSDFNGSIESIKTVLEMGKTSIILIPEISLTPQIAGRFRDVFGEGIALWHSQLTKAQRVKTWDSINTGESKIVIGARSAIFSPIKNLGLIIVDEEHDTSYKQESPSPRYHARDVAIMRGKIESCLVVLSSATPSLETFYNILSHFFCISK